MMYLVFELLFYAGLVLMAAGLLWLITRTLRRDWSFLLPSLLLLVGLAALVTPLVLTRYVVNVDLGPRNVLVDGERHITLTGWDQKDYRVLEAFPETIVLQMANADVDDQTLIYLKGMANLRELDLNDTRVTDAGLKHLSRLSGLRSLKLRATGITDDGFAQWITPMSGLKRLDLRETTISLDAVKDWKAQSGDRRVLR
tara:strand:+ start:74159 stop:74755 length:597 start_codon:yes stop_codon:yes gene_type:complete